MIGITRIEKINNEDIRPRAGVVKISEKIITLEARLRWLGHVERMIDENVVMRTWKMEVGGYRNIGRLKLRWCDVIRKYMKEKGVNIEEEEDRINWILKTPRADPK